jgi:formylglycine-generating enzyme required for sulfatase activity
MNRWMLTCAVGVACGTACTLLTPRENLSGGSGGQAADAGSEAPEADAPVQPEGGDAGGSQDGDAGGPQDADAGSPLTDAEAGATAGRSCQGLAAPCGAEDAAAQSCCAFTVVNGGTFTMGSDKAGVGEAPKHQVTVSTFSLDVFEVTVGRFRAFWKDPIKTAKGAGANPTVAQDTGWKEEWNTLLNAGLAKVGGLGSAWAPDAGVNDNRPMNRATWYVAYAFCAWDGGFLPTEAQWEYAAAGGATNNVYPWGDATPTPEHAVYCLAEAGTCWPTPDIDVGQRPLGKGLFLQLDLAGSMLEWTLDMHDDDWYAGGGSDCNDCANLQSDAGKRTMRGGSWYRGADPLRAAFRMGYDPSTTESDIGIRCAR